MSAELSDPALDTIVVRNIDICGGTPVFRGTRVPIDAVFNNLADGLSLDEVIDSFPSLDRADVEAMLRAVPASLEAR